MIGHQPCCLQTHHSSIFQSPFVPFLCALQPVSFLPQAVALSKANFFISTIPIYFKGTEYQFPSLTQLKNNTKIFFIPKLDSTFTFTYRIVLVLPCPEPHFSFSYFYLRPILYLTPNRNLFRKVNAHFQVSEEKETAVFETDFVYLLQREVQELGRSLTRSLCCPRDQQFSKWKEDDLKIMQKNNVLFSIANLSRVAYFSLPLYKYAPALKISLAEDIYFFIHSAYLLYIYYMSSTLLSRGRQ